MPDSIDLDGVRPSEARGLADETLAELNRLWTIVRVFSNTAHDVNNALQVIAGNAELLEARELDPAILRRVDVMRIESGKAAASINQLLSFARAPRQSVQVLDVWPLLDVAVTMRLASLGRGRVTLAIDRSAVTPAWIKGESTRVLQALVNLLLVAEDQVAGRAKAQIAVAVVHAAVWTAVRVTPSCDSQNTARADGEEGLLATEGVTRAAQLWTAGYLAAEGEGVLQVDEGTLAIRWPTQS